MFDIHTLNDKLLPEIQEIAKEIGVSNFKNVFLIAIFIIVIFFTTSAKKEIYYCIYLSTHSTKYGRYKGIL